MSGLIGGMIADKPEKSTGGKEDWMKTAIRKKLARGELLTDEDLLHLDGESRSYEGAELEQQRITGSNQELIGDILGVMNVPGSGIAAGAIDGALQGNAAQAATQAAQGILGSAASLVTSLNPALGMFSNAVGLTTASDPRRAGVNAFTGFLGGMVGGVPGAIAGKSLGDLMYDTIGDWLDLRTDETYMDDLEDTGLSSREARQKLSNIDQALAREFGSIDDSMSSVGTIDHVGPHTLDYSGADMSKLGHEAIATDHSVKSPGLGNMAENEMDSGGLGDDGGGFGGGFGDHESSPGGMGGV